MTLLELINDKIDQNQKTTEARLESIDRNLAEHMRRTDVLEKLHQENESRIQNLEQPSKTLSLIVKWAAGIGTISGAIYAVSRIL